MRTSSALGAGATLALCATLAACGDDPPAGPSTEVLRVEVNGPSSIAPGQSAAYSVIEYLSNRTTRALPSATWSSSNPLLVQITQAGIATAQPRTGETVISVKTTRTASKEVLVLPAGTFRLVGAVTDADRTDVPIPDATVEAVDGPSTKTNAQGQFRLYGVPPDAEIRVTREGYRTVEERVQLTAHATRNFRLGSEVSPRNYSGSYTLVVTARSPCSESPKPLIADLQQRSYDAVIEQDGARLTVRLTEPRFVANPWFPTDRFDGHVTLAGAQFTLHSEFYYYAPPAANIAERLADGSALMIYGTATTTGSPSGLGGPLNGVFDHLSKGQWLGGCLAATFALTPQ